jgi:hypothetical protein
LLLREYAPGDTYSVQTKVTTRRSSSVISIGDYIVM